MTCRFEKSVGPDWPARRSINVSDTGKENAEAGRGKTVGQDSAGQGQYLVFTPVPDQPQL